MRLIDDGKTLGFSKELLADYTRQLKALKKEAKESRGKGIVLEDETEALLENFVGTTINKTKEKIKVLPMDKTLKSMFPTKVYVGGLGYVTNEERKASKEAFKKLVSGMTGKERTRGNKYIIACNK